MRLILKETDQYNTQLLNCTNITIENNQAILTIIINNTVELNDFPLTIKQLTLDAQNLTKNNKGVILLEDLTLVKSKISIELFCGESKKTYLILTYNYNQLTIK